MAFYLYLIFTISYFLHLTGRIPALGTVRFEFLLGILLLLVSGISGKLLNIKIRKEGPSKWLVYFVAFVILTIPLVEWPGSVIRFNLTGYMKAVFFFILTIVLVDSEKKLKIFLSVFLACQLVRIIEPAFLHITQGYWGSTAYSNIGWELLRLNRLSGAPHDTVNPNQLAWVANNTVPFLFYLGLQQKKMVLKMSTAALCGLILYVLMLTGSRSGLISLLVIIACILLMNKNKKKGIAAGLLILIPAFLFTVSHLTPDLKERYRSLYDESAVGADTVAGRIGGMKRSLASVLNAPIVGHGIGTSREVNVNIVGGRAQLTHNLYIETLQEVGFVGFIIFMLYIRSILLALLAAKRRLDAEESTGFLKKLVYALLVWAFMDLVYSLSCFALSSWEWYLFGGVTVVACRLSREKEKARSGEMV
jgi:O-antigen ligase